MSTDDQSTANRESKSRGPVRRGWILLAAVLAAVVVMAVVVTRDDDGAEIASRTDAPSSSASAQTTTTINLQEELVARLREILVQRERAYQERDPEILRTIYTVDCPCLESDSNAIRELLSKNYVWVGGKTTLRIRRLERVTDRLWTVVATFNSEALRIETESGQLVRSEPQGSDLFQFALAKPPGSTQWLLGRANSYKG
jgi:hypothetical protein